MSRRETFGAALALNRCMATQTCWKEIATLLADAEVRANDAAALDAYRWQLLEASAHLSTARLLITQIDGDDIDQPTTALDQTEAWLLEPLESTGGDLMSRLLAELAPGITGSQGRSR